MLHQAQIIGYLGRDPDNRKLSSGDTVSSFSVASTAKWRDRNTGEQKESTEWYRVNTFGNLADAVAVPYLRKGSLVFVQGRLSTRNWQDKDGIERYSTEIRAEILRVLSSGRPGDVQQQPPLPQQPPPLSPQAPQSNDLENADDIPF